MKYEADNLLTHAINTGEKDDFRNARNHSNKFNRHAQKDKKSYIRRMMRNNKRRWRFCQKFENKECTTPTNILNNGKQIRSPKDISNVMNNFFKDKVTKIRENFRDEDDDAIRILEALIKPPDVRFDFKEVKPLDVYDIIYEADNTKSTGTNSVSMYVLKQIPSFAAHSICHLFNSIIRTGIYPEDLKVSKILPILKPGKDSLDKSSYRPISNLNVTDKIMEEIMKKQLIEHLENNNIIKDEHHGGRRNFSTISAKAMIEERSCLHE